MSLRARGMTALKWSSLSGIIISVIQVAQVIAISRLLKPEHYGMISMIMVFIGLALAMNEFGISNAIIHRQQVTKRELSSLYIVNLAVGALLSLIIWLLAPVAAIYYQEPGLVEPMRWMSVLCFIPAVGQQFQVLFQRELEFDYLAKVDIASFAASFAAVLAGAYMGFGVYALVGSYIVNALLKTVCLAAAGWSRWRPSLHFSRADLQGYVSYGLYQGGSNVILTFNSNIDYLILGRLIGAEKLGYYTFAYQLCMMPMLKIAPMVTQITTPLLAKVQDRTDKLREGFMQVTRLLSIGSGPIYMGLLVTAPYLLPAVFGPQWEPSVILVQILAGLFLIRNLGLPVQSLMLAKGRADMRFRYSLASMALSIPFVAAGAYWGGAVGVSYAYMAVHLMLLAINYRYNIRTLLGPCGREFTKSLLPGVVYSLVMASGVFAFGWGVRQADSQMLILVTQIIWGAVLYAAILALSHRDKVKEFSQRIRTKYGRREAER
jgi:O-antigen/teichoic acid export membrane protein